MKMGADNHIHRSGHTIIELIVGLFVLLTLSLFGMDVTTLVIGATLNQRACSEASRSAAQGPPAQYTEGVNRRVSPEQEPYRRAIAALKRFSDSKGLVRLSPSIRVTETVHKPVPSQLFGGYINGEVTVETTAVVYPPFLTSFLPTAVSLSARTTFPYTHVRLGSLYPASSLNIRRGRGKNSQNANIEEDYNQNLRNDKDTGTTGGSGQRF